MFNDSIRGNATKLIRETIDRSSGRARFDRQKGVSLIKPSCRTKPLTSSAIAESLNARKIDMRLVTTPQLNQKWLNLYINNHMRDNHVQWRHGEIEIAPHAACPSWLAQA